MNEREKIIQLWFEMWLTKQDLGIDNIFTEDVIYTESWSPQYSSKCGLSPKFDPQYTVMFMVLSSAVGLICSEKVLSIAPLSFGSK